MKKEKFEKNAVIYCRVSGNKQAQEGESLETQEMICRTIAKTRECNVVPNDKVWIEPYTGSKVSRPFFDEMMRFVKNNSEKIDYFIFRDIDRLTRGGASDYQFIKKELSNYGVELIDSLGLIQPKVNTLEHTGFKYEWSEFSTSEMAETIKAEGAKDERRTILTRLIGTEIELVQKGFQIGRPNDGFINKRVYIEGKKRTIQIPCPKRQHFFKEMFHLRANGTISDKEIVEKINAMGFKTPKQRLWNKEHTKVIGYRGGNLLSIKQLQRIIQKTIYCGVICRKWTHYKLVKAQYEGLVSIEEFNKANRGKVYIKTREDGTLELLHNYSPNKIIQKRNKYNPLFPYKETVLCPHCKKPLLGSSPKGKSGKGFPTYHCARKHKYFGVNKKELEDNFEDFIRELDFDPKKIKAMEVAMMSIYKSRKQEFEEFELKVSNNIDTLEKQQEDAVEAFKRAGSEVLRAKLEKEIEELENQISEAKEQKENNELTEWDIKSFLRYAKYLMEHHEELLLKEENPVVRSSLFSLVFDEQPTYEEILNGTPKVSFIFAKNKELAFASSQSVALRGIEPLFTG